MGLEMQAHLRWLVKPMLRAKSALLYELHKRLAPPLGLAGPFFLGELREHTFYRAGPLGRTLRGKPRPAGPTV